MRVTAGFMLVPQFSTGGFLNSACSGFQTGVLHPQNSMSANTILQTTWSGPAPSLSGKSFQFFQHIYHHHHPPHQKQTLPEGSKQSKLQGSTGQYLAVLPQTSFHLETKKENPS